MLTLKDFRADVIHCELVVTQVQVGEEFELSEGLVRNPGDAVVAQVERPDGQVCREGRDLIDQVVRKVCGRKKTINNVVKKPS